MARSKSATIFIAPLISLTLLAYFFTIGGQAQGQNSKITRIRSLEPNLYSPNLYADRLKMKFTLINLPGASQPGSYWEISYKLYYISEAEYRKVIMQSGRGGGTITESTQFPEKILLTTGHYKSWHLGILRQRTHIQDGITFKAKIPDKDRTKFAILMTNYSIKIYDAKLKSTVYRSGIWLTNPFADDTAQPQNAVPRTVIYTNFYVSPNGELFESQWPRDNNSTDWP